MAKKEIAADWLVTIYNSKDNVKEAFVIKDRSEREAENEALSAGIINAPDWTMVKMKDEVKRFCKEWGQDDSELATNLELDEDDDGFSEVVINMGYVWVKQHNVWIPENNRKYDKRDDVVVEYIKANR